MQPAEEALVQTLQRVAAVARQWEPGDGEALVVVGAALEEVIGEIPEAHADLADLLSLAIEGLQAMYLHAASDLQTLAETVAASAEAALGFLATDVAQNRQPLLREPVRRLLAALGREATDPAPQAGAEPSPSTLTLDDAAALLVQLEPTDLPELARVRQALEDIASAAPIPAARESLAQAAGRIEAILRGEALDQRHILAEIGRLVEVAAEAIETAGDEVTQSAPASVAGFSEAASDDSGPQYLPGDADPDLLAEFVTESREYIERAEAALLALETNPEDSEAVNTVFRAFHTIKGTSAFLGLGHLSQLAHRAESLLSRVRDHEIRCTGGYADLALRSIDLLKELVQAVQDALGGQPMAKPEGYDELMQLLAEPEAAGISSDSAPVESALPRLGDLLVAQGKVQREDVEAAAADQGEQPLGVALVRSGSASLTDVAQALRTQQRIASAEHGVDSWVRVRTDRLDRLIDMVGELVIAQSMVVQDDTVLDGTHHELSRKVTHAGKIVRELQDLSMSMRMIPLKATFQKMARLVRDLAHKSGKTVDLVVEGEDTEIDRNMVEVLNDPLVHMVRNAVDHGIELPEVREAKGKPRTGTVRLSAYHAGGNVVIEMQDDGNGLDRDKIVTKALAKGLLETDKGMSEAEVFNLIFAPGFSTADRVTDISGRGVGMDVVKRNVEALRGRIDIASERGKGCTFSVRLPLTLAITDGMLVRVGGQRYIVPTASIHLSFRPTADMLFTVAGRGELVMLRGELLPMFRLHRLFGVQGAAEDPTQGLLVIVGDGSGRCALLVDELLGQQQVVAKSLGDGIGQIQGVAGGAILGDGRVGLILDPAGITALARFTPTLGGAADISYRTAA